MSAFDPERTWVPKPHTNDQKLGAGFQLSEQLDREWSCRGQPPVGRKVQDEERCHDQALDLARGKPVGPELISKMEADAELEELWN